MLEIKEAGEKVQLIDIDEMSVEELKNTYELMGSNLGVFQTNITGVESQIANYEQMIKLQQDRKLQEEKNLAMTIDRMEKIRPFLKSKGVDVKKHENYLKAINKKE